MVTENANRPATSLRLLCQTAIELGIGLDIALAGTRLTAPDLDDPDLQVTLEQEIRSVQNVAAAYPDEAGLGVDVGERLHVNSFGIWGFAVLTSPTFRAAVETAMSYIRLSYVFTDIDFREAADASRLVFDLSALPEAVGAYVLERHSLVTMHFAREVVGSAGLEEFGIETTRPASYARKLAERIGLAVIGNGTEDALIFPTRMLDLEVPRSDPVTLRYCLEQCQILAPRDDTEPPNWSTKVSEILTEDIAAEHHISTVAGRLAVNERTLRRRLTDEGTSFREIYADTRLAIARELLETAGLSVESVARRVGYAEPASFVRAFAKHHGTTPGRIRRTPAA